MRLYKFFLDTIFLFTNHGKRFLYPPPVKTSFNLGNFLLNLALFDDLKSIASLFGL